MLSGDVFVNNSGNRYVGGKLIGVDGFLSDPFGYGSSLSVNAMASPRGAARLSTGGPGVQFTIYLERPARGSLRIGNHLSFGWYLFITG